MLVSYVTGRGHPPQLLPLPQPATNQVTHNPPGTVAYSVAPGTARASDSDFQRIAGQNTQALPVPPPGLNGRENQLLAQKAALLRNGAPSASRWRRLFDLLCSVAGSGAEASVFLAGNAVALTAWSRKGKGAKTGWEPRPEEAPEPYWQGVKEAAVATAAVAGPVAAGQLISRWLVKPVATAVGQAVSGRDEPEPRPPEVFFPDPSRLNPGGRPRSVAELGAAWKAVKKGREAVLAQQARFAPGGVYDLACELAHPLAFALQGVALDYQEQRPGILTVGGITLATAGLATGLAETILGALKASATFTGIDEAGHAVELNLFERGEPVAGSSVATRLQALPDSLAAAVREQLRAVAGGADGVGPVVLALAAELARSVGSVLLFNGSTALIDPLDAQYSRTADERGKPGVNAGFTLLSVTVATLCLRLASKLLDRQRDHATGRRELGQRVKAFHGAWMTSHAREVVALHDHLRHALAGGMPRAEADSIVFDQLVEPMMKALRQDLAADKVLYVHAKQVQPAKLRQEMRADHAEPDDDARNTIYIDRLLKLPVEFPQAYAAGRQGRAAAAPVVLQLEPEEVR